jgi:trk system potassium uptake protein TrkA
MYVIVVGSGKVGYYLVQSLVHTGHEVAVLEKAADKVQQIIDDFGVVGITGDGCDPRVLELAGGSRADCIIANTGDDEDNLIICQVAKIRFHIPQTIARVNNPKNEMLFRRLGIDATVNSTDLILSMIEQEVACKGITPLIAFRKTKMEMVETVLAPESPVSEKFLKDISFPPQCRILAILRGDQVLIPDGGTKLEPQDLVFTLVHSTQLDALEQVLIGSPAKALK